MSVASRLRRHPYAVGLCALLIAVVGAGTLVLSRPWRSTVGAQGSIPGPPRISVVAAAARTHDVGVYLKGLGTVTPLNTVTVRSRVDGELIGVHFQEGQIVRSGDLLIEIDPRPFQAQLTQFEGQLERDQALLDNARLDLKRFQELVKTDAVPRQQLDTQVSLVHQLEGTVKNDQGQIDATRVQLVYCRITSPIAGRVGLRLVDAGNIVHATDTGGLVIITQLQPITVIFTIPEDSIPTVLEQLGRGVRLPVEAYDREQRKKLAEGALLTIDNEVDPTTGTVRLKAQFPNVDNRLFPSQFVNARLRIEMRRGATVVPTAAIQQSPRGSFVYVVRPDRTVGVRQVGVGVTDGDDVSIEQGLQVGEQVVVEGAERLRDGAAIALRNAP
jgi:membrane fusion protein, multidrug efflux system